MAEVRRSMGYRFALVSASHADSGVRGDTLAISIAVRNSGWARLYNPRPVAVLLRDPASGAVRRIETKGADPRLWLPGTETTETLTLTVPADLPAGRKEIWLALPDAEPEPVTASSAPLPRARPEARVSARPERVSTS